MFGLIHMYVRNVMESTTPLNIYIFFSRIYNINIPYINHAIKLNAKFAHYCMHDVIIHAR